ncbi:glycosyltransferase [Candidatus Woesearchaeota archaeon]|nr:glycosyltransferase [Candidatus Woesearchaeota archaeon]
MKLSIIIPTLDEEKYIGRLLECLRKQELEDPDNLEVIVVDAGSSDNTQGEVMKYADNMSINFCNLEQKNVSLQRNIGAKKAKGDVLIFMDADIELPAQDTLSRITRVFDEKDTAASTCKVHIDPEKAFWADKAWHAYTNFVISATQRLGFGTSRGACQAVRKEIFELAGGYNPDIHVAEDTELFSRLVKHGKLKYLKDLAVYESPRRFRKKGYALTAWQWTINGLWVFFFGRSKARKWEPVR